jgi:hypothetical protein
MILKWILKKQEWGCEQDTRASVVGSCEHGNEIYGSIKGGDLSNYQRRKKADLHEVKRRLSSGL